MSDNPYLLKGDEWYLTPHIEFAPDPKDIEIERLRARVAVLEKALRQIQTRPHPSVAAQCVGCYGHQQTATYALEDATP